MATIYSTTAQEGIDINLVYTQNTATPEYPAPPFVAGELAWGTDGSEWVYCTAAVTLPAGSVVVVSSVPGSWSVAPIGGAVITGTAVPFGQLVGVTGGGTGKVVIPAISGTQTANYFWVQRAGNAPNVQTVAATTKNAQLYDVAATAGALSSTTPGAASGYQVNGIVISNAAGSVAGPNTAVLNYPVVGAAT